MKNQQIRTDSQQRNTPKNSQMQSLNLQQLDNVAGGVQTQIPIKVKHNA